MFFSRNFAAACLLAVSMLSVGSAYAASSVLIWPVDPVLADDQQSTALWLENKGESPVNLQVRVLAWSQQEFEDQYQNQRQMIGIPQIAQIAPGQKQLVRITRMAATPAGQQQAFRVVIDEIPTPLATNATATTGVRFNMRYVIPLFVYGAGLVPGSAGQGIYDATGAAVLPQLGVQQVSVDGKAYMQIRNDGPVHARLTDASVERAGKQQVVQAGLMGYVLPGASMRWPLPAAEEQPSALLLRINGQSPQRLVIE
jgi:fimbrial chaperone protein